MCFSTGRIISLRHHLELIITHASSQAHSSRISFDFYWIFALGLHYRLSNFYRPHGWLDISTTISCNCAIGVDSLHFLFPVLTDFNYYLAHPEFLQVARHLPIRLQYHGENHWELQRCWATCRGECLLQLPKSTTRLGWPHCCQGSLQSPRPAFRQGCATRTFGGGVTCGADVVAPEWNFGVQCSEVLWLYFFRTQEERQDHCSGPPRNTLETTEARRNQYLVSEGRSPLLNFVRWT